MTDKFQQLSDLLDAQKGAIQAEVTEVRDKMAQLTAIIDQIEQQGGPAIQALVDKAQENLQGIKDIFTPEEPAPTPTPTPEPTPSPEGRRRQ